MPVAALEICGQGSASWSPDIVEWMKQEMNKAILAESYQEFLACLNKKLTVIKTEEEITAALKKATDIYGELIEKYIKE